MATTKTSSTKSETEAAPVIEAVEEVQPEPIQVGVSDIPAQWIPGTDQSSKLNTLREWCAETAVGKYKHVSGYRFNFDDPEDAKAFTKAWDTRKK